MIGRRLRLLRKELGLTQAELGERLEISASAIGMYEQGRREPDNEALIKLCGFFDVSSDYFLLTDAVRDPKYDKIWEIEDVVEQFCQQLVQWRGLAYQGRVLDVLEILPLLGGIQDGLEEALRRRREQIAEMEKGYPRP